MGIFRRRRDPETVPPAEPAPDDAAVDAPDEPEVEAPPEPEPEPEPDPGPPISVLVVDDDEDLRFVMTTSLTKDGFEVVGSAGSAAEALELAAAEPKPDIVLLDLHMPDMGGLELLPLLRDLTPGSKFVVCSAITASYMLEATMDAGAAAFIVKGVSAKSISEHLHRVARSGLFKVVRPYPLNRDYE